MVKFYITTTKHKTIEKAFVKLQKSLIEHANRGVTAYWSRQKDGRYELEMKYVFQNKGANWILKRELTGVVKKIDPKATVETK